MRTVFMGTPEFAVPTLEILLSHKAYDVVGVVTQPDRAAGRGQKVQFSPVKMIALQHELLILQPSTLRDEDSFSALAALAPDLIVVTAFGQLLKPNVLNLPHYGCINVHASLLPRWRGASPITAAILAGDTVTGSTIMRMDEGMDTGPIMAQAAMAIQDDDTTMTLAERLANQGAQLLADTLPCYLNDQLRTRAQDARGATVCRLVKKGDGLIDWTQPAYQIERMIRAYDPWPGAYTSWEGQRLRLDRAVVVPGDLAPGTVQALPEGIGIGTGREILVVGNIQPAGKRWMSVTDFARGRGDFLGATLGR